MLEHDIKIKLVDYLIERVCNTQRQAIIAAEVPFLSGKRWADILLIHPKYLHAFEIKSDSDTLSRLPGQIKDINQTFERSSIVVSKKYFEKVLSYSPESTGIILFDGDKRTIKIVRKALPRKNIKKSNLVQFIWRAEAALLIKKMGINAPANIDSASARRLLLKKSSFENINRFARESLIQRYKLRFERFMHEKGRKTSADDLINLYFDDKVISKPEMFLDIV